MRSVSRSIRRGAAALIVSAVLCGHASTASAEEQSKSETLLTTVIEWLQSRFIVPGG